jgi:acyl-CoA thioesterase II
MADLQEDTEIEGSGGRYRARLSSEWEIWGPQGGYVSTVALRAAGAESAFKKPASFTCHYINAAEFDLVDVSVETLRRSRRAESLRVSVKQKEKPILECLVWTVDEIEGMDHDTTQMPAVAKPAGLKSWAELFPGGEPPFRFWYSLEGRPADLDPATGTHPPEPHAFTWYRFVTRPTFEDPFVDAGRLLIAADVALYPAAIRAHGGGFPFVAPSMDLSVNFHHDARGWEWLLVDAESPISSGGLVGGRDFVWSEDGKLLATGIQQMLQKPRP